MSSFINDIEIKNFKSIRHQKIEGCKKVNVFIGYPNVGKSNILEALSLLAYTKAGQPKISKLCRVQKFFELFYDGNIQENIEIILPGNDKLQVKFISDNEVDITYDVLLSNTGKTHQLQYFKDNGAHIRNMLDSQLGNVKAQNAHHQFYTVKKYAYKQEVIKDEVGNSSLFFPDGQNLFYIIETNAETRKDLVEILATYNLKILFEKGSTYSMKVIKTATDETYFSIPFYQIADTLQRLIFYKAAIKTNNDSVLLFEEPESHMFPPYIRKFTSDVIFDKTNQFFIATHSPYVLEELLQEIPNELAIYLVDYKDGATVIQPLSTEDLEEARKYGVDLFFNLESYLTNGKINNA